MLNQGLFNLYNWGNLILGTLPNAPWTLRFSILVGGSKHFSLSCVSTEDNISNTFSYFFPWPREVSSNIGWSVLCWTLKGHHSQLSFSYFYRAHSSLVFSENFSQPGLPGSSTLPPQLKKFFELWFGSPSLFCSLENPKAGRCGTVVLILSISFFLRTPVFVAWYPITWKMLFHIILVIFIAFHFYFFVMGW